MARVIEPDTTLRGDSLRPDAGIMLGYWGTCPLAAAAVLGLTDLVQQYTVVQLRLPPGKHCRAWADINQLGHSPNPGQRNQR